MRGLTRLPPGVHVTAQRLTMGAREQGQLGGGWYAVEDWPPPVRWTGPEAVAYLRYTGESQVRLRLFSGPAALRRAVGGTIYVGTVPHAVTLVPGQWCELALPVPPGAPEVLPIGLHWEQPWSPRTLFGSADTRLLGVAVAAVWLEAV